MTVEVPRHELFRIASTARRTWLFIAGRQRLALLAAMGLMAVVGYCAARIPLMIGELVDGMINRQIPHLSVAYPILGAIAAIYLLREALQLVRKLLVERSCTTIERDATIRIVESLFRADLGFLASERAGSWNGRVHRSVEGLVRLLKLSFLDFFPAMFTAGFALYAAASRNLALGLLMASIIPIALAIIARQISSQSGTRMWLLRAKQQLDGTIVEQLGGIENIRAADTLDLEMEKVSAVAENLRRREYRHHVAMMLFDAGKSLNEGIFHIAVVILAILLALRGAISAGDILAFSLLFAAVIAPLREIHRIIDEGHESTIRCADFFSLLNQPPDRSFLAGTDLPTVEMGAPLIEATDLGVHYADGGMALDGVTLSIRAGETIGITGPSGSGKTSLVRAMLRLVHPSGKLRIADIPIDQVSRGAIGRNFGFVSQNPFILTGTIAENIAYGSPAATAAGIADAAHRANIGAEIEAFPDQYDTLLTERGNNLSGGQRQRIGLARLFLKEPPIMILDEATAALDYSNERLVIDALEKLLKGRTVIIIAHRLSTLQKTDRIYFFEAGRLAEQGTYASLTAGPTKFARMLTGQDRLSSAARL